MNALFNHIDGGIRVDCYDEMSFKTIKSYLTRQVDRITISVEPKDGNIYIIKWFSRSEADDNAHQEAYEDLIDQLRANLPHFNWIRSEKGLHIY